MALIGSDSPRRLHYRFGQVTVRRLASKDATRFVQLAKEGRLATGLAAVWTAMANELPEEDRFPPEGIDATAHAIAGGEVVMVTLPTAEHLNEPYFVAVVIKGEQVDRYLVLEHSWNLDDTPSTWIGEWREHEHRSLGQGPGVDEEAFLRTVVSILGENPDERYHGGFRY
jgi:hypothetical protein